MAKRIAFMDPLVLAIAADEKTVTRRLGAARFTPGDVLDVCEALVRVDAHYAAWDPRRKLVAYRCDGMQPVRRDADGRVDDIDWTWKVRVLPARYCPAWAVRHRILVEAVTRETLSCVTDGDARREGIARMGLAPTAEAFLFAFRGIHKLPPDADPELTRIAFRRVTS